MLNKLKNSSFFRAIFLLSSGSLIAQGIRAIATPILTRIYSPEAMGQYTYLISISAIFMGISNLRYEVAIVTDPEESHVFPLIKLSTVVGVLFTIIASLILGLYFFINGKPIFWTILLFFNILAYSITNVLTAYNNRKKEYKLISSMYVIRTGIQYIFAILLGLIHPVAPFLLIPYVVGEYMGISKQAKSLKGSWCNIFNVDNTRVREVAVEHKKQPFFSMPALLSNSLSYSLITIFIERLFGMETVGFYSISVSLLGLPLAVIGSNISKVFMQKASEEYALDGTYKHSFNKTFITLLGFSVPMVVIMFFLATPICKILFGQGWAQSGTYIMILAPMFGVRFITSALSPAFTIIKKQQTEFVLQGVFLIANIIGYFITKRYDLDINGFLVIISILFSFAYILYLTFIFLYSRRCVKMIKYKVN